MTSPAALVRSVALVAVALPLAGGCEGLRSLGSRAANNIADLLEPEAGGSASADAPSASTAPSAQWVSGDVRTTKHTLEVRGPVGTRVFYGVHEESIGPTGRAQLTLDEAQVLELGELELVASDGSRSRLALPELPGPRLAELVRLTECSEWHDELLVSGPIVGTQKCAVRNAQLHLEAPDGARVELFGSIATAEHDRVTLTLDLLGIALEHAVALDDPEARDAGAAVDATLPLRVQWRGQTLDTTVELRFAKGATALGIRDAVTAFEGKRLELPGRTDAVDRTLVAFVDGTGRMLGRPAALGEVDLVALREGLPARSDGRCGPYGRFGWGNDYVPRKAHDERWTVYDARSRAVVATRTFKSARPPCPHSVVLDEDASIAGHPDGAVVVEWLRTVARSK